jgi:hypothetical protein
MLQYSALALTSTNLSILVISSGIIVFCLSAHDNAWLVFVFFHVLRVICVAMLG